MKGVFTHPTSIVETKQIGDGTRIWTLAHVMDGVSIREHCRVGDHCFIAAGSASAASPCNSKETEPPVVNAVWSTSRAGILSGWTMGDNAVRCQMSDVRRLTSASGQSLSFRAERGIYSATHFMAHLTVRA